MASGEVINGTDVMVFISTTLGGSPSWKSVAHATSHSLSMKMATRDTSNKGTANFVTKASGRLEVTGTLEGMYIDDDTYNYADFAAMWIARTPFLMVFGRETSVGSGQPMSTSTAGGAAIFYASGQFILTGLDATFPDQQNSTYTATFEHYTGFVLNTFAT
jgi:hypothetical protein